MLETILVLSGNNPEVLRKVLGFLTRFLQDTKCEAGPLISQFIGQEDV